MLPGLLLLLLLLEVLLGLELFLWVAELLPWDLDLLELLDAWEDLDLELDFPALLVSLVVPGRPLFDLELLAFLELPLRGNCGLVSVLA